MDFTVICPPVALKAHKEHFFPRLLINKNLLLWPHTEILHHYYLMCCLYNQWGGWATDQAKSIHGLCPHLDNRKNNIFPCHCSNIILFSFTGQVWTHLNIHLRFLVRGEQLKNAIAPNSVKIFHFNEEYGLNDDLVNTTVLKWWNQEIHDVSEF